MLLQDYMAPEVLRNPASHLQESAAVSYEVLGAKGIRPYDEKVRTSLFPMDVLCKSCDCLEYCLCVCISFRALTLHSQVDVWAVGVLAYELVVGKPPFEVEDEAQTAQLIMYSDNIRFPAQSSQLWADFVKAVLVKDPAKRPSASALMSHHWWVGGLGRPQGRRRAGRCGHDMMSC
jgi:serine/threonine protein kinase